MVRENTKRQIHIQFQSGFTLLELAMIVVIIAALAAVSYGQIQNLLVRARLMQDRQWARMVVLAIESYSADTGGYPNSVFDLTTANPRYLDPDVASRCGRNVVQGGKQWINQCIFNTAQIHYLVQYTEWDLNGPVMIAQYLEHSRKTPWNSGVCGIIPPGASYFLEMLNGTIIGTSCGYTN